MTPIAIPVTVNSGDPTASDSVVVTGTAGTDNTTITPTGADSATIQVNALGLVTVNGTERLTYSGLGGNDVLSIAATAGSDTIVVDQGPASDVGKVAVNSLLPVNYQALGSGGSLTLVDQGGANDRLVVNGSSGDDNFTVLVTPGVVSYQSDVASVVGGTNHVAINVPTAGNLIEGLVLNSLDGSDNFVINQSPLFGLGIAINAGNPSSGSDRVSVNGTAGNDNFSLTLGISNDSLSGVVANDIQLSGVESLSLSTGGGDDSFTVNGLGGDTSLSSVRYFSGNNANDTFTANGTTGNDAFIVTPVNANLATISANGRGPLVEATLSAAATSVFTVGGVGGAGDSATVVSGSGNDVITVVKGANTTVDVAGGKTITIPAISTEAVILDGGNGNDIFNVSGTAASGQLLQVVGGNPTSNTGPVSDTLIVTLATAGTTGSVPGATPDAGVITNPDGNISYSGLEFIALNGAAGLNTLNIQGTHDDDTIAVQNLGGSNRAWVNDRAVISFGLFQTINVNALFGSDEISITPNLTPEVTAINVAGGDPTGSDTLILNGRPATQDQLRFAPTAAASGTITGNAGFPTMNVTGVEHLRVVLEPAATDYFTVDGTAGNDNLRITSGPTNGSNTITGVMNQGVGAFALPEIMVTGNSSLVIGTFNFNGVGGVDTATVVATDQNDTLTITRTTATSLLIDHDIDGGQVNSIGFANLTTLIVEGLDGDDTFNVGGDVPAVMNLHGGNPSSGSDTLNFNGSGVGAVTLNLGADTIQEAGFPLNVFTGFETVNANANGQAFNFFGTAGDDSIIVDTITATDATMQVNNETPEINLTNATAFTIDGVAGSDVVEVRGTGFADFTNIVLGATTTVQVNPVSLIVGVITASTESIEVNGQQGNDFIVVNGTGSLANLLINGGGDFAGDFLSINAVTAGLTTYLPGSSPDSGRLLTPDTAVDFLNLELAQIIGLAAGANIFSVFGTGADDQFSISGANGNQVTLNDQTQLFFANIPTVNLFGGAGNDHFSLDSSTLVGVNTLNVDGGLPTASDTVVVDGTAVNDTVTVTPTATDAASVTGLGPAINLTTVEHLTYSGLGGDDNLIVTATANADTIVVNQGPQTDRGNVSVNSLLAVAYQGLGTGAAAALTLADQGGNDRLVVNGSATDDNFTVNAGGDGTITYQSDLASVIGGTNHTRIFTPVAGNLIEGLILNGLDGSDNFVINASALFTQGIAVNAGNPTGGSDRVTANGTAGNDVAVLSLNGSNDSLNGIVGGAIQLSGVENLTVGLGTGDDSFTINNMGGQTDLQNVLYASGDNAADTITINGSVGNDAFTVKPLTNNSATIQANGRGPLVEARLNLAATSTFTVDGGAGVDSVSVHGTIGADTLNVVKAANTTVELVGNKIISITSASTEAVTADGGDGNDLFNVSGTASAGQSLSIVGGSPTSNAGAVSDTLNLTMATAGTTAAVPGATPDAGVITNPDGNIVYSGLEFFNLTGAAGANTLNAQGTHDNDTLALQFLGGANRIWVNDRAVYTFTNYQTVNVNGLFGDDKFSVHPVGLVGVTTINVAGGDPNASDELVVNGTAGNDTINYLVSNTIGSGAVQVTGAPVVNFVTTESLVIDGLGGTDPLTVTSPPGGHRVTVTPGSNQDSGTIVSQAFGAGTASVPLTYQHIGAIAAITLAGTGDIVEFNGTANSDTFAITGTTIQITNATAGFVTNLFNLTNISLLEARGHDGDDLFNVTGSLAAIINGVVIDGGNPSASDLLNVIGGGGAITQDYGNAVISAVGSNPINYIGVELISVNAANANVTVLGTVGDDSFTVQPTGPNSTKVELTAAAPLNIDRPVFNASNVAVFTIDAGAGDDHLKVLHTSAGEQIAVNGPAGTVSNAVDLQVNFSIANTEALAVFGAEGSDTFTVTSAPNLPIFIDGGDPIGITPGDVLVLNGAITQFKPGPENDEGGFQQGANGLISFDHIESAIVNGAPCALVVGTNGDDDITVIARTAWNLPVPPMFVGANGVQDFTTSVNGGIEILWLNTPDLFIDALSGDDDITIQSTATSETGVPVVADWDVDVRVVGGPPSAPTNGDRLVLQTPGQDTLVYTPNSSETGTLVIDANGDGVYTAASNDSQIQLVSSFQLDCDQNGVVDYSSSVGGMESVIYDGEGADDVINFVGSAANDTIRHTPGVGFDEGSFRSNTTLAISYQNLGVQGAVLVNGAGGTDTLEVDGTNQHDDIRVFVNGTTQIVTVNNQLPIRSQSFPAADSLIETITIRSLNGDDDISVFAPTSANLRSINVEAGDSTGADQLNIVGQTGVAESWTLTTLAKQGSGQIAPLVPVTINYAGIEHINMFGNPGDNDDLTINDTLSDSRWTVSKGTIGDRVQINSRESIDYATFNDVLLQNLQGTDEFNIYPSQLLNFTGNFTVQGDGGVLVDDIVRIFGTDANDTVTSTATAVSTNNVAITIGASIAEVSVITLGGNDTITLALNLAGVRKVIDAGSGNDVVNALAMLDATIFGGDGDDTLTGSPVADIIYGGAGNDVLIGAGGIDYIYGEDGNDRFGDPAVADAASNDPGNDFFFGGAGVDTFVWDPGDGSDTISGGDDDGDLAIFNGSAAANTFVLAANATVPSHLNLTFGPVLMTYAGVESLSLNALAGADAVTVNDLFTTGLKTLNIDLGAADAAADNVFVNGRTIADDLAVTAPGSVRVEGFRYDISIANAVAANDRLTVSGNEGDDTIKAESGVENTIAITLNGNAGDDFLSADAILNGGDGDDTLIGGLGADQLNGNDGDDLMVGGGGADTYDGGAGFDTILISGTPGRDTIDVRQPNGTTLEYIVTDQFGVQVENATVAGATQDTIANVEEARIEAGNGADTIRVAIADELHVDANAINSLRMSVFGGNDASFDRLGVIDVGTADLSILRQDADITGGTVEIGPAIPGAVANGEAFLHLFSGIEFVQVLADTLVPTANPVNIESPGTANRLVVFKHDPFEHNNDRNNATHLGAVTTLNLDPNIDPGPGAFGLPGDNDWYRVEATYTGTIDFQVIFEQVNAVGGRPGLPATAT